jgi:hypothetical protein
VRWATLVIGILLLFVGTVWIFQGVGMLKGSFMTGQALWAWIGTACVMLGLPALVRGARGGRARR